MVVTQEWLWLHGTIQNVCRRVSMWRAWCQWVDWVALIQHLIHWSISCCTSSVSWCVWPGGCPGISQFEYDSRSKWYAGVFLSCSLVCLRWKVSVTAVSSVVLARYAGFYLLPWTCVYGHGTKCRCFPVSLTLLVMADGRWLITDAKIHSPPDYATASTTSQQQLMVVNGVDEDQWRLKINEGWMSTQGCIFLPYRTCGTTFFLVGVNVRSFPNHWNVRNVGWIIWWTLWTSCPLHIWTESRSINVTTIMYIILSC